MRVENVFCEECGIVHFVQVVQRDARGMIVKTKCLGKDFVPVEKNQAVNEGRYYVRHRRRGYDLIMTQKRERRKRLPSVKPMSFLYDVPLPPVQPKRVCVAELSMNFQGRFLTIKVFEDATAEKFYEFFYEVTDKPAMVKPRNLGREKAVHISDITRLYRVEGQTKLTYHNGEAYERLLTVDVNNSAVIFEKNKQVVAAMKSR